MMFQNEAPPIIMTLSLEGFIMSKPTIIFWVIPQQFLRSEPRLNEISLAIFAMIDREFAGYAMNAVSSRELALSTRSTTQRTVNHKHLPVVGASAFRRWPTEQNGSSRRTVWVKQASL